MAKQTMIASAFLLQTHAHKAPHVPARNAGFPSDDQGTLCHPGSRCISLEYNPVHVRLSMDPYLACATYPSACRATCDGHNLADLRPGRCPIPGEYIEGCVSPDVFDPVCGSDAVTYTNSDDASCHQIYDVTQGACVEVPTTVTAPVSGTGEVPTPVTAPVSGPGGEVPTPVTAPVAGPAPGTYVDGCVHIAVWDPVCGSNGVTYSNSGEAACFSVTEYEKGPCSGNGGKGGRRGGKGGKGGGKKGPDDMGIASDPVDCDVCPAVYEPLMAIDYTSPGSRWECTEFSNSCKAHCAGIPEAYKRGLEREDGRYWLEDGTCPQPGQYIPGCVWLVPLFDWVCGSNGVTYQNPSESHCNGIYEYTKGHCDDQAALAPVPEM